MRLYDEAIDTLYRATWDYACHSAAYFELSQISAMRGEYEKALSQVDKSLSTNSWNNRAVALKTSILRKLGEYDKAMEMIGQSIESDPLDFRIQNEYYLTLKESGSPAESEAILKSLNRKMRNFDENYLDLAVGYLNDGFLQEAKEVLLRFDGENPMFGYYLGYIADKNEQGETAKEYFDSAANKPVDYVFPHRLETINILNTALKYNPDDGKAYYYMGNILYEKQPETAIGYWEKSVKNNPGLAVAFRNLGWGYYRHYKDIATAISYYEKAIDLTKSEAIYYSELDALYELNNAPVEKRLKLFQGQNDIVKERDDAFIRQIAVLTMADQPEKAVEYLDGVEFVYREGSSRVRETIIDAQLILGEKYIKNKDYNKALEYFLKAQIPEEEAGSARMGSRDIQVNYFIGLAYEALGEKTKANEFFRKSAERTIGRIDIMNYYQGLSYAKLGDNNNAKKTFEQLIDEANQQLKRSNDSEAGVIFGEREAENVRKSRYYTMKGLGNKGLKKIKQANEDLKKAVGLLYSNLWAKVELEM
jgi:tetratricopeptide (TPR) repeat protein